MTRDDVNAHICETIRNEDEKEMTDEELLVYNLIHAELHAKQALDLCYKVGGCKRSLWYRMVLGRAQSILMSLTVRELGNRKD